VSSGPSSGENASRRAERIGRILAEVAERRVKGESVADADVIATHPELMPELGERLKALGRVEAGRREVTPNHDATVTVSPATGKTGDLKQTAPPIDSISGYEIVSEMHRGGQGVVYRAVQESTRRKVAIKVMKEGPFGSSAEKARFDREVLILGQLNHPNIVTIHDSGSAAGSHYFVMDYVSGRPLDEHMLLAKPTLKDTLRLFAKICEAVNAAHLRGIIHRDLKPGNIRVDPEGEPHVLDFGLAKVATRESEAAVMTMTGDFVGSLPWASPEQAEAAPSKIDLRTDVYSLGVILYQMLTGRFPYEVVGNVRDVLDNILRSEPKRPSTIRVAAGPRAGRLNDEIDTIVLKCLSKERERRYQTAGELARDIGHYLAGEPIEAKRDSAWYILRKLMRRHKVRIAGTAAILVLLSVVVFASLGLQRSHQRERIAKREAAHHAAVQALLLWLETVDRHALHQDGDVEVVGPTGIGLDEQTYQRHMRTLNVICERILAGSATDLDYGTFVRAFVSSGFETRGGRRLLTPEDTPSFYVGTEHYPVAEGLGILPEAVLLVDGHADADSPQFQGTLITLPAAGALGASAPALGPGSHRIHGHVRIRIVRSPSRSEYGIDDAKAGVDFELIPRAEVLVGISPFEFEVVREYPENYPPRIVDPQQAQRFDEQFVLKRIAVVETNLPWDRPAIRVEMSLAQPAFAMPFEVTLSATEPAWERRWTFHVPRKGAPRSGGYQYWGRGGRARRVETEAGARYEVQPCLGLDDELASSVRPGQIVHLNMRTSRDVALDYEDVPVYLDAEIERSIALTRIPADPVTRDARIADREASLLEEYEFHSAESGDEYSYTQSRIRALVSLYEYLGKAEDAAKWRAKLTTTTAPSVGVTP
jgi:hypothetical protein